MGVQSYLEADIQSIPQEKLLVLLYEKMGSDLLKARQALSTEDRVGMADRISHSQQIVAELRSALDHSVGGEISRNLESLYDYLFLEQLAILVDRDPRHIDNCLAVLRPLLDAWRKIPPGTADEAARARGNPGAGHTPETTDHPTSPEVSEEPDSREKPSQGGTRTSSLFSVSA